MADLKVKRGSQANLDSLAVEDGSLIITTDDKKLYSDVGTERIEISDVVCVDFNVTYTDYASFKSSGNASVTTTTSVDDIISYAMQGKKVVGRIKNFNLWNDTALVRDLYLDLTQYKEKSDGTTLTGNAVQFEGTFQQGYGSAGNANEFNCASLIIYFYYAGSAGGWSCRSNFFTRFLPDSKANVTNKIKVYTDSNETRNKSLFIDKSDIPASGADKTIYTDSGISLGSTSASGTTIVDPFHLVNKFDATNNTYKELLYRTTDGVLSLEATTTAADTTKQLVGWDKIKYNDSFTIEDSNKATTEHNDYVFSQTSLSLPTQQWAPTNHDLATIMVPNHADASNNSKSSLNLLVSANMGATTKNIGGITLKKNEDSQILVTSLSPAKSATDFVVPTATGTTVMGDQDAFLGTTSSPWTALRVKSRSGTVATLNNSNTGIVCPGFDYSNTTPSSSTPNYDKLFIQKLAPTPPSTSITGWKGHGVIDLAVGCSYTTTDGADSTTNSLLLESRFVNKYTTRFNVYPVLKDSTNATNHMSYLGTSTNPWDYVYGDNILSKTDAGISYHELPVGGITSAGLIDTTSFTEYDYAFVVNDPNNAVSPGEGSSKSFAFPYIRFNGQNMPAAGADFVVDYYDGSSTRWVKWASGRFEQWMFIWKGTINSSDWASWGGSSLYNYNITNTSWPVAFSTSHNGTTTDIAVITTISASASDAILWAMASNVTATTLPKISLVGPGNITRYNVRIDIHGEGYWK
nr:hypothetical protein DGKKSRWO_DGKKSRWO_CDS_0192 [uncultured phage]CAI9752370.1 hypothetical protein CVNMHQAP_CVNMHQAP_CDS_0193 [uncultured phage]